MIYTLILKTLILLFLAVTAVWDKRELKIPLILTGVVFAAAFAISLIAGIAPWWKLLLGCLPGASLLIIALLSRGAIGPGDGLVFIAAGPALGLTGSLFLLIVSLLGAAAGGFFLVAMHKIRINDRLAFVPYILGGYIVWLIVNAF